MNTSPVRPLLLCFLLTTACVDQPEITQDMGGGDANMIDGEIDQRISRIEIVLDGVTPAQELVAQQGSRIQLKVQGFNVEGKLVEDNIIAQTTVLLQDMTPTGLSETSNLTRKALVLSQRGNIVEVLERGRGRLTVETSTGIRDNVILNATENESKTGSLPRLTTLRRGEPLFIEDSLTAENEVGEVVSLISLCTGDGEVKTEGAISIFAVDPNNGFRSSDLTFSTFYQILGERTGIGKLVINCPKLAERGLPTSMEYVFRVKSATEIVAGDEHTCAMLRPQDSTSTRPASNVLCWGKNERGQVGLLLNGKRQDVTTATTVLPSSRGPIEIAAGPEHTCALLAGEGFIQGTRSGDISCWGDDRHGQTAPIDRENAPNDTPSVDRPTLRSTPIPIDVSYVKFASICGGQDYSCALSDRGRLLCWGENSHGQLGLAAEPGERVTQPTEIFDTQRYQDVSCGAQHLCATTFSGESQCWGRNHRGQLGVDPAKTSQSSTPIVLEQDNVPFNFEALSLGTHTSCGLQNDVLYCWGDNTTKQLSNFIQERTLNTPTRINLSDRIGERVESISISADHACAVTVMDTLSTREEEKSCLVATLFQDNFAPMKPITSRTCAERGEQNIEARRKWLEEGIEGVYTECETRRLYCWGDTRWGQIIRMGEDRFDTPQEISCEALPPDGIPSFQGQTVRGSDVYRTVATGTTHSCVAGRTTVGTHDLAKNEITVDTKEKVWCWGRTDNGKTGGRISAIVSPSATSTFKKIGQGSGDLFQDTRGRPVGQPRELAVGDAHGCVRTCLPGTNPNKEVDDSCEDLFDAQHHILCWGSDRQGQRARTDGFETSTTDQETTPSAFQIERSTMQKSATFQRLVSGTDHLCALYQTHTREEESTPRIEWEATDSLRCWGKNTHQQAGASIGASPHGNPAIGISGGPDPLCKVINFSDRLGDLHTCGFTLTHDYAEFFKPKYSDMTDLPFYERGDEVFQCWNAERKSTRQSTDTLNDLAFSPKGQAYCWGNGSIGQHGRGADVMADARPSPDSPAGNAGTYFNGLGSSDNLMCGWRNFFATGFGEIQCWGADPAGLVKDWEDTPVEKRLIYSPLTVEGWNTGSTLRDKLKAVTIMAMGESHICVMSNPQNKYVVCWGDNTYGQIGGTTSSFIEARDAHFVKISESDELTEVVQLTSGSDHTCALTTAQKLYCWGRNDRGQVGAFDEFGNVSDSLYAIKEPYEVKTFAGKYIKSIKAVQDHTCALVADDIFESSPVSIHCWGSNDLGQSACFDASITPQNPPGDQSFCKSTTPWARRPFITQAFP